MIPAVLSLWFIRQYVQVLRRYRPSSPLTSGGLSAVPVLLTALTGVKIGTELATHLKDQDALLYRGEDELIQINLGIRHQEIFPSPVHYQLSEHDVGVVVREIIRLLLLDRSSGIESFVGDISWEVDKQLYIKESIEHLHRAYYAGIGRLIKTRQRLSLWKSICKAAEQYAEGHRLGSAKIYIVHLSNPLFVDFHSNSLTGRWLEGISNRNRDTIRASISGDDPLSFVSTFPYASSLSEDDNDEE